jgi:hypothetical protein
MEIKGAKIDLYDIVFLLLLLLVLHRFYSSSYRLAYDLKSPLVKSNLLLIAYIIFSLVRDSFSVDLTEKQFITYFRFSIIYFVPLFAVCLIDSKRELKLFLSTFLVMALYAFAVDIYSIIFTSKNELVELFFPGSDILLSSGSFGNFVRIFMNSQGFVIVAFFITWKRFFWDKKSHMTAWIYMIILMCCIMILALSLTRGIWIGVIISLVIGNLLKMKKRSPIRWKYMIAFMLFAVVIISAINRSSLVDLEVLQNRLVGYNTTVGTLETLASRLQEARIAFENTLKENILFGHGFHVLLWRSTETRILYKFVHIGPISLFYYSGLLGLIIYSISFGYIYIRSFFIWKKCKTINSQSLTLVGIMTMTTFMIQSLPSSQFFNPSWVGAFLLGATFVEFSLRFDT